MFSLEQLSSGIGFWEQGVDRPFNSTASPLLVKKGESPSSHQTSSPRIQAFPSLLIPQTYPSSATGAGPGGCGLVQLGTLRACWGETNVGQFSAPLVSAFNGLTSPNPAN